MYTLGGVESTRERDRVTNATPSNYNSITILPPYHPSDIEEHKDLKATNKETKNTVATKLATIF
jgi:hypothetical protein